MLSRRGFLLSAAGGALVACAPAPTPDPGSTPPDLTVMAMDGSVGKLSERLQPGKLVIINFWATWCEPCKREMPELAEFGKRRADVQILGINVQEDPARVRAFFAENSVEIPTVIDPSGQSLSAYRLRGLPTTVFVGADGRIRAVYPGQLTESILERAAS